MASGPDASSCGRFSGDLPRRLGPIGHGPAASLGLRRGREAKGGCTEQRHDVVTVTFSLGLLRSMASPTSTNSLSARQSLDWPLWSGHFPASSV